MVENGCSTEFLALLLFKELLNCAVPNIEVILLHCFPDSTADQPCLDQWFPNWRKKFEKSIPDADVVYCSAGQHPI